MTTYTLRYETRCNDCERVWKSDGTIEVCYYCDGNNLTHTKLPKNGKEKP